MNSFFQPFKDSLIFKVLLTIILFLFSLVMNAQVDKKSELYKTLKSKDSIIFDRAFNKCEIEKLEPIVAENFEFYHDVSGVQNKKQFIKVIKNNLCTNPGIFSRKLEEKTLAVFELKNNGKIYGAIQRGKHLFYIKENNKKRKTGTALFTHVWILENNNWKLKRVLSFNHKEATE